MTLSDIPSRAEFVRDRLAEHLDGHGYSGFHSEPETLDESPTLYFEWASGDMTVFVDERGAIRNVDEPGPRLAMRGFSWEAEPTDTGVMHGPWLAGAHVVTPDGRGIAQPSEFGALDVVRVVLDGMDDHPGYCYPRCYVWPIGSRGAREVERYGISTRRR